MTWLWSARSCDRRCRRRFSTDEARSWLYNLGMCGLAKTTYLIAFGVLSLVALDVRADADATEIDALIEQLGDPSYEVREAADAELREVGIVAADALARCFKRGDDYEKCLRIQRIAEHIFFWDRVLGHHGFLGISHQKYGRQSRCYRQDDERIPPDISAFSVEAVIEGTSAQQAGIQQCDIIIAVNGVTLPNTAELTDFADQIRDKKPGTEMVFEFWRGRTLMTKRVKIGHRPAQYYLQTRVPEELKNQYEEASHEFSGWWVESFGPWDARLHPASDDPRETYLPLPQPIEYDK